MGSELKESHTATKSDINSMARVGFHEYAYMY